MHAAPQQNHDAQIFGIGIAGLATAFPSIMVSLGRVVRSCGGTARAFTLRGQSKYRHLAWASWPELKAEALMQLQRLADRGSENGFRNIIFGHSLGSVIGLLAAEQYTRAFQAEVPNDDESLSEAEAELSEHFEPGYIDTFVGFNPCFQLTWLVWLGMLPCLFLLLLFGNWPGIGHLLKLIPVWRIRAASNSDEISWLPLGAVYLVWQAMRESKKLFKAIEQGEKELPFRLVFFAGTDDFVCDHRFTGSIAKRFGGTFVPIALGRHSPDLGNPDSNSDSEWEWKFERLLKGKDPTRYTD